MKIFTALLLAGLFLFNAIGYQLLFAFLILHQEKEMDAFLADSENDTLAIIIINPSDKSDFSQISEKEFFYKGFLYDIKKKEIKNGKIILCCKKDEKEIDLLNHFSRLNDENKSNSSKNPVNKFLQKSVQNLFLTNLELLNTQFPDKKHFFNSASFFYEQPDSFQLTPPPQIYFS